MFFLRHFCIFFSCSTTWIPLLIILKKLYIIKDQTQDPSSVYFLHPSDSASTKLVSMVFDGSCYNNLKRPMTIGLDAKNKLSFVNGSLSTPNDGSLDEKS